MSSRPQNHGSLTRAVLAATVPSDATSGPVSVTNAGGTATSTGNFTVIPAPTLTAFTPTSGTVGRSVVLSGTGFEGAQGVSFNGTAAIFTVNSDTLITATVPAGASAAKVAVTTPSVTATSATSFVVVPVTTKLTLMLSGLTSHTLKLGKRVTVKGIVTPVSLAGNTVTLTVQRESVGKWRKVTSKARSIGSSGAYGWSYRPAGRDTYRLRTTIAKTVAHTAATTTWRTFKVQ